MHHSYLSGADFSACDLSNANLSKAHLEDTMINESVLDGVDLQFALFDGHSLLLPSRWNLLTNVIGSNFASAEVIPIFVNRLNTMYVVECGIYGTSGIQRRHFSFASFGACLIMEILLPEFLWHSQLVPFYFLWSIFFLEYMARTGG